MKFSKKEFEEEYQPKGDSVDELFSSDGDFGGDKPVIAHTEITTDTQKSFDDESDYKEDIPQTPEDYSSRTKNMYNMYNDYGNNMGTYYNVYENKNKIKNKILEFRTLKLENDISDFKEYDLNDNNIPDINELNNNIIVNKTNDFIKSINNYDIIGEELGIILNYALSNLNLNEIPNEYKDIIKNLFN